MISLLVIPSIDIQDKTTVRVVQGIPELGCHEYANDPVEMAEIWRAENARMLHIVDFNAIHGDAATNFEIVKEICSNVIIPVQFAAGIRTVKDAEKYLSIGVSRIMLSSLPVNSPDTAREIIAEFGPSRIVAGMDVIDNEIVLRGKKIGTGIQPLEMASRLEDLGFSRIVVTDVSTNGMVSGPNIRLTREIAQKVKCKITHSGGVRNKDELFDLTALAEHGVDSVIIGRALYENRFPCQKLWRVAEAGIFA